MKSIIITKPTFGYPMVTIRNGEAKVSPHLIVNGGPAATFLEDIYDSKFVEDIPARTAGSVYEANRSEFVKILDDLIARQNFMFGFTCKARDDYTIKQLEFIRDQLGGESVVTD